MYPDILVIALYIPFHVPFASQYLNIYIRKQYYPVRYIHFLHSLPFCDIFISKITSRMQAAELINVDYLPSLNVSECIMEGLKYEYENHPLSLMGYHHITEIASWGVSDPKWRAAG